MTIASNAESSVSNSPQFAGYRVGVAFIYLVVAVICGLAVAIDFRFIDDNIEYLARERGNALFRLVELTRDWNAGHGGVYVPVTEQTQPNPYLSHPKRDLTTVDGMRLTMVNPAFMTRQIAEIAEQADGVKFRITSLKPMRPGNGADDWEAAALRSFDERKTEEALALVGTGEAAVYRYMAPLYVKKSCLVCHATQGYVQGMVRGGISVTMPAARMLAVRAQQRQRAVFLMVAAAVLVAGLLHYAAARSRRYFLRLSEISAGQERLIAERTQELSAANAHLLEEVAERQRNERLINDSKARYRSVIEASQDGILIFEAPAFCITFANERAAAILGCMPEQMIGHPILDYIHPLDRGVVADRLGRRLRGEPVSASSRLRFLRAGSQQVRVADVHVAKIDVGANEAPQWVVNVSDMTDRIADERALQIAAAVMENASEGIIVTDSENLIIQANPAFSVITGYPVREVLGRDPKLLASGRHGPEFYAAMWQALVRNGHWEGEIWNRRRDGTIYASWLAISTIHGEAAESGGRHVATFIDITQRKEAEELLRHKAQSDPLTDLPNRALFYDRLQMSMTQARRYGEAFALLYIDLDHFKAVNDSMGHAAGDELLLETARRLRLLVRESDTVARLGGDEFAVILPKIATPAEAEDVARRVVGSLGQEFLLEAGEARISASVGVAIFPEHGEDMDVLKRSADAALYAAKAGGRNAYRLFGPGMA